MYYSTPKDLYLLQAYYIIKEDSFVGVFLPIQGFPTLYVLFTCMLVDLHGYCYSVVILYC
jgi:hypothetical protein